MRALSVYIATLLVLLLAALAFWTTDHRIGRAEVYLPQVRPLPPIATGSEPITPIPSSLHLDQEKVALGRQLFHDARLSGKGTVSCASCHSLTSGGTDNEDFSIDADGLPGSRNTLTVLNAGLLAYYSWDGRFTSLGDQLHFELEEVMGTDWTEVLPRLTQDEGYVRRLTALYEDAITPDNIVDALVVYQSSLITPNSRFDRYLRGDQEAISTLEKTGYNLFKSYGCITCHQGVGIGGNMFSTIGVTGGYLEDRDRAADADPGRYDVTGREHDRYRFRVASLRNVGLTAPYFHDASASTLENAIQTMARYQLGRTIPESDVHAIASFLLSLTGEHADMASWGK